MPDAGKTKISTDSFFSVRSLEGAFACNAFGRKAEWYYAHHGEELQGPRRLGFKPGKRVLEPRGSSNQLPSSSSVLSQAILQGMAHKNWAHPGCLSCGRCQTIGAFYLNRPQV